MAIILAVDDSASLRQMLVISLQNAGHEVVSAEEGRQALALAKEIQFDFVLTDLNMPIMDGLELVTALRALPDYVNVPILILSTEDSTEKKQAGRQAGANGWLKKPIQPRSLLTTIDTLLV